MPQKHVQRTRIILLSADRLPVLEVAASNGASWPSVWRWQQRFAEEGVEGLLRDKTRKPGRAPLPPATIARVLALPCGQPPKNATHWQAAWWPAPSASASALCSASGKPVAFSRIESGPSRNPTIRHLPPRSRISLAST